MKYFSACWLLLVFVLTACERSVKPTGAGALKPTAAIAKRESIDQTSELETHPRALEFTRASEDHELEFLIARDEESIDTLIKRFYSKYNDASPSAPKAPDGFTATANRWCPIMQKMKLNASTAVEHTVEFEGRVVGFCCEDCRDAWASMDDTERRERLKAVLAKKP